MAAEKEMGKNEWYTRERIRKEDASAVGWGGLSVVVPSLYFAWGLMNIEYFGCV